MESSKLISLLEIQKDFGADWVFSGEPNSNMGIVEKTLTKSVSNVPNVNTSISEMAKKKNNTAPQSEISVNVSSHSTSTEEWIKKAKELADGCDNLDELKKVISSFYGLSIKKTATNTVFGEGNRSSKLMLIGEAPGENEDLEGRPFCGVSGRLLDAMFKHVGYTRNGDTEDNSFYITNSIFWRPPGNRKPTPEEIAICKPFVEKHIALIKPQVIVLIGATATYSVLGNKDSISLLKRSVHQYSSELLKKPISTFAIYHPSFLLRQPAQKKNAWFDLLKIKKFFETL